MTLGNDEKLREPMSMPDPLFPIKVHHIHYPHTNRLIFGHHWHEHLEFLLFTEGGAIIECGSNRMETRPGDLVAVNSNQLHYGESIDCEVRYYAMILDISLLSGALGEASESKFILPLRQGRLLMTNHIRNNQAINACILSIVDELVHKELGYELAIKSQLYQLMTLLLRTQQAKMLTSDEHAARQKNVERFQPVLQHIDLNYGQILSVDALAEITGLSRYHFSRLFKEVTGRTISQYIIGIRLDKADHLLRHTSLTVSEVATATGFSDIFYFSRMFRKHRKSTPSAIREGRQ